jgi:D-hexose-6-phosphate mutarotase
MHGFARLSTWEVIKTSALNTGETELILGLKNNPTTQMIWPYEFSAEMRIIAGTKLDVTLTYSNTGKETFVCTDALHSYFNISDTANIGISGLKGHRYYAGFAKEANNKQFEEVLPVKQEENRRYINHIADCIISDKGLDRKIRIAKRGSKVTVVWNPWEATAKSMADIPDDGYKTFVCVEAANYYNDSITLKPGESHSIATVIEVESMQ